jgi:hypothetical protein
MQDNGIMKNHKDNIHSHLEIAFNLAQQMQVEVQNQEGDSDLYRKLACYLVPGLNHWINGPQAGNMKDLDELFKRRVDETERS